MTILTFDDIKDLKKGTSVFQGRIDNNTKADWIDENIDLLASACELVIEEHTIGEVEKNDEGEVVSVEIDGKKFKSDEELKEAGLILTDSAKSLEDKAKKSIKSITNELHKTIDEQSALLEKYEKCLKYYNKLKTKKEKVK